MKRRTPSTVVITGASSGIGRQLAIEYAKRGAHVMAIARRAPELESLCRQIEGAGGRASSLACDVADPKAAKAAVEASEEKLGSLDMVIANAGVAGTTHAARLGLDEIVRMVDVNVRGAMATLVAAVPIMLAQKHGQLVGVSSLAGRRALPSSAPYCATKAALSSFLEGLRIDLAGTGIDVTDVQPGFVDTPLTAKNDFAMPFMWDAPKAARVIAARLERAPRVVAFPFPLTLLTRLSRHVPFGLYSFATRTMSGR